MQDSWGIPDLHPRVPCLNFLPIPNDEPFVQGLVEVVTGSELAPRKLVYNLDNIRDRQFLMDNKVALYELATFEFVVTLLITGNSDTAIRRVTNAYSVMRWQHPFRHQVSVQPKTDISTYSVLVELFAAYCRGEFEDYYQRSVAVIANASQSREPSCRLDVEISFPHQHGHLYEPDPVRFESEVPLKELRLMAV